VRLRAGIDRDASVIVAVDGPDGGALAADLAREGVQVVALVAGSALAGLAADALLGSDSATMQHHLERAAVVLLDVSRDTLDARVVALCDRLGVRIVPRCATPEDERLAAAFGLAAPVAPDDDAFVVAQALRTHPAPRAEGADATRARSAVIAVWGPAGAPGRSTVAIAVAAELARGGERVALVDADSHAPSIALALGLADEAPGFAAACRQAELGTLTTSELTRIAAPVTVPGGAVEVLTGINRPSRWPELGGTRVTGALAVTREWARHTVVDVAASLERDEEIVSDVVDGPRRNAATLSALREADLVVAVAAADPLGVSRFLRGYAELRATVGATPVAVAVNRLRAGALGVDAHGQVRRALERFAGIRDVWFLPADQRAADAALLAARPIADAAPRSALTLAVRRFVGEAVVRP
jgi:MinD-like ATPase involved in chromosome partitioning or flagellar assembly